MQSTTHTATSPTTRKASLIPQTLAAVRERFRWCKWSPNCVALLSNGTPCKPKDPRVDRCSISGAIQAEAACEVDITVVAWAVRATCILLTGLSTSTWEDGNRRNVREVLWLIEAAQTASRSKLIEQIQGWVDDESSTQNRAAVLTFRDEWKARAVEAVAA